MDTRFIQVIEKYGLLKQGESVLTALSGGPDSVALLRLLWHVKDIYRIDLGVAHLDHGVRDNSVNDRFFCRELCRELKVRFHSKKVNVIKFAGSEGVSVEDAGRKMRYEYFEFLSDKYGYDKIATGHTADDNAETVIFNIARGSGLGGLSGIQPKRGKIIRPLIEFRKNEITRWLGKNGFDYRIDESNDSTIYTRNRIRQKIIPQMERLNSGAVKNILRLSRNIRDDIELIGSVTVSAYEDAVVSGGKSKIVLDLEVIKDYDEMIGKKLLIETFRRLNRGSYSPSSKAISRAMSVVNGPSGGKSPFGAGIWIEKSKNRVSIFKQGVKRGRLSLKIPGITEIPFSDLFLETEVLDRKKITDLRTVPERAFLDRGSIRNEAVRFWKNGDKIRPFGMRGRKLLSDIFSDRGIPSFERKEIPLVVSGDDIAWIAGVMIADDFKVGPDTKSVLSIKLCAR